MSSTTQEPIFFDECNCGYCPEKFEGVSAHLIRYAFLKSTVSTHQCDMILKLVPELVRYVPLERTTIIEASFNLRPSYDYNDQGISYISPATDRNWETAKDVAWFKSLSPTRKKEVTIARKRFIIAKERLYPNPPK